ncbi:MAG: hypothetical protein ACUBOA_09200 [Candidatus Loosdrechtia sp.]|uniref:hypothetical protein n=1 Tax=Candidatus Loosdrechtia sp. TaxID=3101272 RepID=UPI003A5EDD0D|nr:MAG: hypothetical protein QY305_02735 [Candidatus Jettenia sp. AMX2]
MGIIGKPGMFVGPLLNILSGAASVLIGTYIFSRIKEKQDTENRLARIEELLQKLAEDKEV